MAELCLLTKEWKDFWHFYPGKFSDRDFLRQVGKTHKGKPIDETQFNLLVSHLYKNLDPAEDDRILDVCCGNGLLTSIISNTCKHVVGIDFSSALISIARKHNRTNNISYHRCDALAVNEEILHENQPFSKVYMYEALQHFQEDQLPDLLSAIMKISVNPLRFYLASILDKERIDNFYNTAELREQYNREKDEKLLLGTWWEKEHIKQVCLEHGLTCAFIAQPEDLYTAHYRFDVLITNDEG